MGLFKTNQETIFFRGETGTAAEPATYTLPKGKNEQQLTIKVLGEARAFGVGLLVITPAAGDKIEKGETCWVSTNDAITFVFDGNTRNWCITSKYDGNP